MILHRASFKLCAILLASFLLTGCIPWVISASLKADAANQAAYSQYVTEMERLNTERELAKLPPRPVLTFPDWKRGGVTNSSVATPQLPPRGR